MSVTGWMVAGASVWLLLSCGVGLVVGAVIRAADVDDARPRTEDPTPDPAHGNRPRAARTPFPRFAMPARTSPPGPDHRWGVESRGS